MNNKISVAIIIGKKITAEKFVDAKNKRLIRTTLLWKESEI